jgi:preprotein translocase subunit SecB
MADEPKDSEKTPRFFIKGQYIKDLSFENPNAPHSLIPTNEKPTIDVSVNLKVAALDDGIYEITLHLGARAMTDERPLFLVELDYCGIAQLSNIPKDRVDAVLMVDCPFVLFPFARRVIADVTRDGGFPPLMLEPVDFHSLYMHNKQQAKD